MHSDLVIKKTEEVLRWSSAHGRPSSPLEKTASTPYRCTRHVVSSVHARHVVTNKWLIPCSSRRQTAFRLHLLTESFVLEYVVWFVTIIDILDCSEIPMEWAIPLKFWRKMNTISNLGFSFVCVYNSYVSILMFSSKQHFRNFTLDLVPIWRIHDKSIMCFRYSRV